MLLFVGILLALSACQPIQTLPSTKTAQPLSTPTITATARPVRIPTQTLLPPPTAVSRLVSTLDVKDVDLRGLQIQFWYPQSGKAEALLLEMIAEFNRTNRWGITIEPRHQNGPGGMDDQFEAAQAARSLPDLLVGYAEQAARWDAAGGILLDLDPYIADPVWGLTVEALQSFYPEIWSQDAISVTVRAPGSSGARSELKRLGMPWYRTSFVLFYNQSWARELGFPTAPQTPDEFRRQACAASQEQLQDQDLQNDGSGGWLITPDASTLLSWIYAYNGEILRTDGNGYRFNTVEVTSALRFLKDLATEGCAWQAVDEDPQVIFAARRALFYAAPTTDLALQQTAMEASSNQDAWTVLPFPSVSNHPGFLTYGPSLFIVQSSSSRQLASWLFIRWLASPEKQVRWVEVNGDLPTSAAVLKLLDSKAGISQWREALKLLPEARSQPNLASWSTLRWVLVDSQVQLYAPEFTAEEIPGLLKMLDELASEIYNQVR